MDYTGYNDLDEAGITFDAPGNKLPVGALVHVNGAPFWITATTSDEITASSVHPNRSKANKIRNDRAEEFHMANIRSSFSHTTPEFIEQQKRYVRLYPTLKKSSGEAL